LQRSESLQNLQLLKKEFSESAPALIFAKIQSKMAQQNKYRAIYWLVFLASTAGLIFAIYSHWEWLTLILPFVTTSFVKAMDIM